MLVETGLSNIGMGVSSILPESESINITIQEKVDETEIPGTKLDQDV